MMVSVDIAYSYTTFSLFGNTTDCHRPIYFPTMDLLQRELQRKKKALLKAKEEAALTFGGDDGRDDSNEDGSSFPSSRKTTKNTRKRKYLKMADLRRIEEEEKEKEELDKHHRKQLQMASSSPKKNSRRSNDENDESTQSSRTQFDTVKKEGTETNNTATASAKSGGDDAALDDHNDSSSVTRQLRELGLVICFFGENHDQRVARLRGALEEQSKHLRGLSELDEFRLGKGHGIRNPFLERDFEQKPPTRKSSQSAAKTTTKAEQEGGKSLNKGEIAADDAEVAEKRGENDEDDQSDPPKIVYKYLKGLLKEWEQDLADRSESVARTVAGRNESKTLKQCKDYIRPLFKLLKSRKLEDGLLFHLLKIVNFAKEGEFVKAHDTYMDVAIGRAAWPIGVTMVGIHARSGRAKIESAKVAHVMNSELQRKYLTSVKRLLTFAQKKRPDVDPSKKVT